MRVEHDVGKTTRLLASEIGTTHTTVGRWVRGERQPTGDEKRKLIEWDARFHVAPTPTPAGLTAADARGVRYAAEVMAVTLAEILRTARELDEATVAAVSAAKAKATGDGLETSVTRDAAAKSPRKAAR